jgi:hypothetical protein
MHSATAVLLSKGFFYLGGCWGAEVDPAVPCPMGFTPQHLLLFISENTWKAVNTVLYLSFLALCKCCVFYFIHRRFTSLHLLLLFPEEVINILPASRTPGSQ